MRSEGIDTSIHYPTPIHLQPGTTCRFRQASPLTRAEESSARILSLPMFPSMSEGEVARVVGVLRSALGDSPDA